MLLRITDGGLDNIMNIGKLYFGKRLYGTNEFKFFYCPLLKENSEKNFWFFWWIGYHWYVCLPKHIKE